MSGFYIGQEVVCVDNEEHDEAQSPNTAPLARPIKSILTLYSHYTIRDIDTSPADGVLYLKLVEISRPPGWVDNGFWASRFRPIDPKKIEIFRQMCVDVGQKIQADEGA